MKKLSFLVFILLASCTNKKDEVVPDVNCNAQNDAVDIWLSGKWTVVPNATGIDSLFFNPGAYQVEECGSRVRIQSRAVTMKINSYSANAASVKLYYYGITANTAINRIR